MNGYRTLEKLTEGLPVGDPLGLRVEVIVDRPIGSRHPHFPETVYPVNYGFVTGILGGDGNPQDVYILGVNQPKERFRGRIIAVIHRADDNEEKWVAAPEETVFFEPEIRAAVDFVERHFQASYRCLFEKACGAVLFSEEGGERRYLLVQGHNGRVGFSKGHIEGREDEKTTALREIWEETGLIPELIPGFRQEYCYRLPMGVHKDVVFFLGRFSGTAVFQPEEIAEGRLLPYQEALEALSFPADREVLRGAEEILNSQNPDAKAAAQSSKGMAVSANGEKVLSITFSPFWRSRVGK